MSLSGASATVPEKAARRVAGGGAAGSGWLRLPVIIGGLLVVLLALSGYIASVVAGPDSTIASAVNNLGQLAAAFGAALAAAVAVHRHTGRQRRAWLLVAVACGSWTAGQLIWYVEVVRAEEVPQVSIADLFFRDNAMLTRHLENRERELERQAFADQLTGLPNRALFTDRVVHALRSTPAR